MNVSKRALELSRIWLHSVLKNETLVKELEQSLASYFETYAGEKVQDIKYKNANVDDTVAGLMARYSTPVQEEIKLAFRKFAEAYIISVLLDWNKFPIECVAEGVSKLIRLDGKIVNDRYCTAIIRGLNEERLALLKQADLDKPHNLNGKQIKNLTEKKEKIRIRFTELGGQKLNVAEASELLRKLENDF